MKILSRFVGALALYLPAMLAHAAPSCPSNMVFMKTPTYPLGECLCPSGERPRMDISNSIRKLATCPDTIVSTQASLMPFLVDTANLKVWLDSSDPDAKGYYYPNSSAVGSTYVWRNKVPGGSVALSQSGAAKPVYVTNQLNGLPVMQFTADYLSAAIGAITQTSGGLTVFAVASTAKTAPTGTAPTIASHAYSLGSDGWALYWKTSASYRPAFNVYRGTWATNEALSTAITTPTAGQYYVLTGWSSSGITKIFVNGVPTVDGDGNNPNISAHPNAQFTVGASQFSGWTGTLNGNIAEVLVYTTALNDSQRESVEAYLRNKWGLSPQVTDIASANLKLWLDATDPYNTLPTLPANGTVITSWKDKSGTSNHMQTGGGTPSPVYREGMQNGRAVIRFNGAGTMWQNSPSNSFTFLNNGTDHTVCVVGRAKNVSSSNYAFLGNYNMSSLTPGFVLYGGNSGRLFARVIGAGNATYYDLQTNTDALASNTMRLMCVVTYAALNTSSLYINGTVFQQIINFAAPTGSSSSNPSFNLAVGGAISGYYLDGDIGEVVIYNKALTDEERRLLENNLRTKWALW